MAKVRMQVALLHRSGFPRDNVVNTFYLDTDPGTAGTLTTDYESLATDAEALWRTFRPYPSNYNQIEVKAYHMGDDKPREPKATVKGPAINASAPDGAREVALCLSFFSERNLPRKRGRLYIGPWTQGALNERPDSTVRGYLATLANGIAGLGGPDVDWVIYSPTTGTYSKVTDWWVDDEWDVQRRRGMKPQTRTVGTTSE